MCTLPVYSLVCTLGAKRMAIGIGCRFTGADEERVTMSWLTADDDTAIEMGSLKQLL